MNKCFFFTGKHSVENFYKNLKHLIYFPMILFVTKYLKAFPKNGLKHLTNKITFTKFK